MGLFDRLRGAEARAAPTAQVVTADWVEQIGASEQITRAQAMNIPAVAAGVKLIADAVAGLPVRLYERLDGKTREVTDDPRPALLNGETGDSLTGEQLKTAMVMDYLLDGAGYAYVERRRGRMAAVKYLPRGDVSVTTNQDPLNKAAIITVLGVEVEGHRLIKLLNSSRDGFTGRGLVERCNQALLTSYKQLAMELSLANAGGGRRGFLQAQRALSEDKMQKLREAWRTFAQTADNTTAMVLNEGITFKEASSSLVEMQLNELMGQNAQMIAAALGVPLKMLTDAPTDEMYRGFVKTAVRPVLDDFEAALDHAMLYERERGTRYFAFDTRELTRGDITTRYGAYKTALEAGFLQPDEVRERENLEPLGLDFVRLGLQDVYYYPKTKTIYTPNTGVAARVEEQEAREPQEMPGNGTRDAPEAQERVYKSGVSVRNTKKEAR